MSVLHPYSSTPPPTPHPPPSPLPFRHLYLRDVRVGNATLAAGLAAQLGAAASRGEDPATAVAATLAALPISLGGGKATVALADAVPAYAVGDLVRAVEDFGRGKL